MRYRGNVDRATDHTRLRCAVGLGLGLAFFGLYMALPRDWDHLATHNAYFFADVGENAEGLRQFVFGKPLHRHVLFSLVGHPLYLVGNALLPSQALAFPTAVMGSAGVVLLYCIASSLWPGTLAHVMISMLYGVSAASIIYAGIPETYIPVATLVMATFLVWIRRDGMRGWIFWTVVAVLLVLVGLMNPVVFAFLVAAFSIDVVWKSRSTLEVFRIGGVALLSGLLTYLVRAMLILRDMSHLSSWETVETSFRYLSGHGSFEHFLSAKAIWNVILNTWLFSIGGLPSESFRDADITASYALGPRSLAGYFHSVWGAVFALAMGVSLIAVFRCRKQRFTELRVAWVYSICHILFFVWFNPHEALLYSPPALGLFLLLLSAGFMGMRAGMRTLLLGCLLASVMVNNVIVFAFH